MNFKINVVDIFKKYKYIEKKLQTKSKANLKLLNNILKDWAALTSNSLNLLEYNRLDLDIDIRSYKKIFIERGSKYLYYYIDGLNKDALDNKDLTDDEINLLIDRLNVCIEEYYKELEEIYFEKEE